MLRARLNKDLNEISREFLSSLGVDKEFAQEDIWGSEAHVIMLHKQKVLSRSEAAIILSALEKARRDLETGKLKFDSGQEDIHPLIEEYVMKSCGPVGGKLHTARSRNDQVATDTRMHARGEILTTMECLSDLVESLLEKARKHRNGPMPGYTHQRHAQPITLGFLLSAYAHALFRDLERMEDAFGRVNRSPLGSCALAGTSFRIDRKLTARLLGFDSVMENALDAVASRDFVAEVCFDLSMVMSSMSRLAEDLIHLSSKEVGLIELDDAYCTSSSIMPHKKNPDTIELIKGKTGGVYAALDSILVLLKGLPMTYGRDLQEDRGAMWNAFKTVGASLRIMKGIIDTLSFHKERGLELLKDFSYAVEIANYLVREKDIPFREAHQIVGSLVRDLHSRGFSCFGANQVSQYLSGRGIELSEEVVRKLINPGESVNSYASQGSSSPRDVSAQANSLRIKVKNLRNKVKSRRARIEKARKETERAIKGIGGS